MRPQIEIRSADSLPPAYTASVGALYKGLLYCDEALAKVESIFAEVPLAEFQQLYRDSWRHGLQAKFRGGTLQEVAAGLLPAATRSLKAQFKRGSSGADESQFLAPLEELVASGVTLAERLLQRWQGSRQEKMRQD